MKILGTENYGEVNIFTSAPEVVTTSISLPDEILGELNDKEGKAKVTIKIDIYDKEYDKTDACIIQSYTRNVFIVRDNDITK